MKEKSTFSKILAALGYALAGLFVLWFMYSSFVDLSDCYSRGGRPVEGVFKFECIEP
jgi:hypothetical protein